MAQQAAFGGRSYESSSRFLSPSRTLQSRGYPEDPSKPMVPTQAFQPMPEEPHDPHHLFSLHWTPLLSHLGCTSPPAIFPLLLAPSAHSTTHCSFRGRNTELSMEMLEVEPPLSFSYQLCGFAIDSPSLTSVFYLINGSVIPAFLNSCVFGFRFGLLLLLLF